MLVALSTPGTAVALSVLSVLSDAGSAIFSLFAAEASLDEEVAVDRDCDAAAAKRDGDVG